MMIVSSQIPLDKFLTTFTILSKREKCSFLTIKDYCCFVVIVRTHTLHHNIVYLVVLRVVLGEQSLDLIRYVHRSHNTSKYFI